MPGLPGVLAGASLCARFLTQPQGTTCPNAFFGTSTCSQCGQTDYTQYLFLADNLDQISTNDEVKINLYVLYHSSNKEDRDISTNPNGI